MTRTAAELLPMGVAWLRKTFPDAVIVEEMSLSDWGGALIDIAAICEDQIIGLEIKGKGDSPSRLKLQGQMYSRVCRRVYLLPSSCLADRAHRHKPPAWKMLSAGNDAVQSMTHHDPQSRGCGYGLAPAALASMIWTREYGRFMNAAERGGLSITKAAFIHDVQKSMVLTDIEKAVCAVLRARDWIGDKRVHYPADMIAEQPIEWVHELGFSRLTFEGIGHAEAHYNTAGVCRWHVFDSAGNKIRSEYAVWENALKQARQALNLLRHKTSEAA